MAFDKGSNSSAFTYKYFKKGKLEWGGSMSAFCKKQWNNYTISKFK